MANKNKNLTDMTTRYFMKNDFKNLIKDIESCKEANDGEFTADCKNKFLCQNGEILSIKQWCIRIQRSFPGLPQQTIGWKEALSYAEERLKDYIADSKK